MCSNANGRAPWAVGTARYHVMDASGVVGRVRQGPGSRKRALLQDDGGKTRARCFSSPWSRGARTFVPERGIRRIEPCGYSVFRRLAGPPFGGRDHERSSDQAGIVVARQKIGGRYSRKPRQFAADRLRQGNDSFVQLLRARHLGHQPHIRPRRRPVRPDTSILRRAGNALVRRTGRRAVLDLDHGFEHRLYAGRVHAEARSVMAARRCWPTAAECPFGRRHTISRVTREDASRVHVRKVVTVATVRRATTGASSRRRRPRTPPRRRKTPRRNGLRPEALLTPTGRVPMVRASRIAVVRREDAACGGPVSTTRPWPASGPFREEGAGRAAACTVA